MTSTQNFLNKRVHPRDSENLNNKNYNKNNSNYLFTGGSFSTTLNNFSNSTSKAVSVTAGSSSLTVLATTEPSSAESNAFVEPCVAILCFFKKAAEKPDAKTCLKKNKYD